MSVLVESAHETPLVTMVIAAPTGTASDPPGVDGFLHHVAELARRGAGDRNRAQLDAALDALGASLHVSVGRDSIGLQGMCLSRSLDDLVAIAISVLAEPRFEPEEHEQLIRETGYEIDELYDDDSSLAARFFARSCRPGHPYARTAMGTRDSLRRFDLGSVRDTYRRLLSRRGVVIGFAGDIDAERAAVLGERLRAALADVPPLEAPTAIGPSPSGRRTIVVDKPDRQQSQLLLGHGAPRYGSEPFAPLVVAETAFGGMFSSRLMQEIRVKRGWSYGASCRIQRSRLPHWLRVSLAPSADVTPDALALTIELYEELAAGGLDASEIELAVKFLVGSMAFDRATARQRLSGRLRRHLCGVPEDYDDRLPERLAAVDRDAINAAIAAHFTPQDLCTVVVATADEMLPRLPRTMLGELTVVPFDSY